MIKSAAGLGAAGVASSLVATGLSGTANAAPLAGQERRSTENGPLQDGPIVAHVNDVRDGTVDLFFGDDETTVHSPELARALAQAAARGR
jgi:hypothetical protein